MHYKALFPLSALLCSSVSSAHEQQILKDLKTKKSPLNAKFASLVNDTLHLWHVPGIAIGVVDGDEIWTEGYGIATLPCKPVTPSTLFYAGSTTKAFTAAALALLIDSPDLYPQLQPLEWKTPIVSLLPDFALQSSHATNHITLEDVLSHRTGFPEHTYAFGGLYPCDEGEGCETGVRDGTVMDLIRSLKDLDLSAELRERFQYSSAMYVVASAVVERLTGEWLGSYLKKELWEKLGMRSTPHGCYNIVPCAHWKEYFSTSDAQAAPEELAQGYIYNTTDSSFISVPFSDLTIISGAGSVISNVLDYTKWLHALLNSSPPLAPSAYTAIKTPRTLLSDNKDTPFTGPQAYTLGWGTGVYHGYEFFQHGGGMESFGAQVIFFPGLGNGFGVVGLGNTAGTSNFAEQRVLWELIDDKMGVPKEQRWDWNRKNQAVLERKQCRLSNAEKIFYPSIPNPPLPPTLTIKNYEGTYYHPSYHNMTFILRHSKLYAFRNVTWETIATEIVLEHASGDYFTAYIDSATAPGGKFREAVPAEFLISSEGVVSKFGIAAEPQMGIYGRIWFERI